LSGFDPIPQRAHRGVECPGKFQRWRKSPRGRGARVAESASVPHKINKKGSHFRSVRRILATGLERVADELPAGIAEAGGGALTH